MLPNQNPTMQAHQRKSLLIPALIFLIIGSAALITYSGVASYSSARIQRKNLQVHSSEPTMIVSSHDASISEPEQHSSALESSGVASNTELLPEIKNLLSSSWDRRFHRQEMVEITVTGKVTDKRNVNLPEIAVVLEIPALNRKENSFTDAYGLFQIKTRVPKAHIIEGTVTFNHFEAEYLPKTLNVYFYAGNAYRANFPDVQLEDIYDYARVVGKLIRADTKEAIPDARIDVIISSPALKESITHDLVTTSDGRFALSEKGLFEQLDVTVEMKFYKQYFKDVQENITLTYAGRYLKNSVVVEMEREKINVNITGRLIDEEEKPFPSGQVLLQLLDDKNQLVNVTASVNSKGEFEGIFPNLDKGGTYNGSVNVTGTNKNPQDTLFTANEANGWKVDVGTFKVIHIREEAQANILVVDNNARPLQGADIGVLIDGKVLTNLTADVNGSATFKHTVLKGIGAKGTVQAHHEFFVADKPAGESFEFTEANNYTQNVTITVKRKKTNGYVTGSFTDEDGNAVAGINIKVYLPDLNNFVTTGTSNSIGFFNISIPNVERGVNYVGNLSVTSPQFQDRNISYYLNESNTFIYTLTSGPQGVDSKGLFPYQRLLAQISGKVIDAENKSAIEGAEISIELLELPREKPAAPATENSTSAESSSTNPPPPKTVSTRGVKTSAKKSFSSKPLTRRGRNLGAVSATVDKNIKATTGADGSFKPHATVRSSFTYNATLTISKPGYKTNSTSITVEPSTGYGADIGTFPLEQEKVNASVQGRFESNGNPVSGLKAAITVPHENNKVYQGVTDENGTLLVPFEVQKLSSFPASVSVTSPDNQFLPLNENVTFSEQANYVVTLSVSKVDRRLINVTGAVYISNKFLFFLIKSK